MGMIINPNTPLHMLHRVIFQIISSIFCNKYKFALMRKTVNIILNSIRPIVRNITAHTKIGCDRNSQIVIPICDVLNLTLFPSFSKALKTNFRNALSVAREHFFKQSLLNRNKFIILTLMKGDKVVYFSENVS